MAPVTSSHVGHPGGFSCLLLQIMQRLLLEPQLSKTPVQQGGTVGTEQGTPLCRSPGSCSAAPQPSPGVSSPSQSVAKQSLFCSERCLRFFHASQAFFLEAPVPESSGYVKTCLHLDQKRVSRSCDPRGMFVTVPRGLAAWSGPACLGAPAAPRVHVPEGVWSLLGLDPPVCTTQSSVLM